MAKQHDSLMNDFSNLLWAYGGDYFEDDEKVGSLGSAEPGEPQLDLARRRSRRRKMYRKMLEVAHPSSLGWDWTGAAEGFMAGQFVMVVEWHEFASGIEESKIKGKVGYVRLPKGPKRTASMFGGTGIGINGVAPDQGAEGGVAVPRVGDLEGRPARQPQERRRRGQRRRATPSQAARGREGRASRRRRCRTSSPPDAVFEAWEPENIGLRPKIAAWNECDTTIFTQLSKMLAGQQGPEDCMPQHQGGLREGHREREALPAEGVMATTTVDERSPRGHRRRAKRKESRFGFEARMLTPALSRAGRAVHLPVHLPDLHEPVGGRADRRDLARLRRAGQLVAAVHRRRGVGLPGCGRLSSSCSRSAWR